MAKDVIKIFIESESNKIKKSESNKLSNNPPPPLPTTTVRTNFMSEFCSNDEFKVIEVAMIIF